MEVRTGCRPQAGGEEPSRQRGQCHQSTRGCQIEARRLALLDLESGEPAGRRQAGDRLQVEGHIAGRLKALFRSFLQAMTHDAVKRWSNRLPRWRHFRRIVMQNRRHGLGGGVAPEGTVAG
jgi:hypothetical protein